MTRHQGAVSVDFDAVDEETQRCGAMPLASDFPHAVYEAVRQIPEGKVATYGDIARLVGKPQHARQVGNALKLLPPRLASPRLAIDGQHHLPNPSFVPWHRVLNAQGVISARGSITAVQRQANLLRAEGIEVGTSYDDDSAIDVGLDRSGGRVNLRLYRWDPAMSESG